MQSDVGEVPKHGWNPIDADPITRKFWEIRDQLDKNVQIVMRGHPDSEPRILPHIVETLTDHVYDRLNELQALLLSTNPAIEQTVKVPEWRDRLLGCVHQPSPTDKTRWDIAPGKHRAFQALIAELVTAPSAPDAGEVVGWVTPDILAAMKRGERAVPGWKYSADFCIPLYASSSLLTAARQDVERLTRERDELERNRDAGRENFLTMQGAANTLRKRAEQAEARATAAEALIRSVYAEIVSGEAPYSARECRASYAISKVYPDLSTPTAPVVTGGKLVDEPTSFVWHDGLYEAFRAIKVKSPPNFGELIALWRALHAAAITQGEQ